MSQMKENEKYIYLLVCKKYMHYFTKRMKNIQMFSNNNAHIVNFYVPVTVKFIYVSSNLIHVLDSCVRFICEINL